MQNGIYNVRLTERHLSSKYEAAAIDGDNVEGYFRGSEVTSGVYYYRMKAGAFNSVKKMLLVK